MNDNLGNFSSDQTGAIFQNLKELCKKKNNSFFVGRCANSFPHPTRNATSTDTIYKPMVSSVTLEFKFKRTENTWNFTCQFDVLPASNMTHLKSSSCRFICRAINSFMSVKFPEDPKLAQVMPNSKKETLYPNDPAS